MILHPMHTVLSFLSLYLFFWQKKNRFICFPYISYIYTTVDLLTYIDRYIASVRIRIAKPYICSYQSLVNVCRFCTGEEFM
jgi:hypothetical protein